MAASILIVDDEADIRNLVKGILEDEGYAIEVAANSQEACAKIEAKRPHLVILDIWLQGSEHDGLEVLENLKASDPHLPVVMISGHGTIETAVSAIKKGAYDFIEKPFKADRLILMIRRALEAAALKRENESLKRRSVMSEELIGSSQPMQTLKQMLDRVALTNSRVLLTGEPGSGKDIAARFIHKHSERADQPFMVLSCATLRPDRLELELFGSEDKTAGQADRTGVLEKANGGTLVLDEVADMPLETQGKIVRVLQNQSFQRVGGNVPVEVDVRIIASTNRDLEKLIEQGKFRQDLYYRLNVVPVKMPPLRERPQDIAQLTQYFSDILAKNFANPVCQFSKEAVAAMQSYSWPGNIRQLRNTVEWVMIMNSSFEGAAYGVEHLPAEISGRPGAPREAGKHEAASLDDAKISKALESLPLREARELFERDYLVSQIERFNGNISKTAQFVGMERSALHRKLKTLNISFADKGAEKARSLENTSETLKKTA